MIARTPGRTMQGGPSHHHASPSALPSHQKSQVRESRRSFCDCMSLCLFMGLGNLLLPTQLYGIFIIARVTDNNFEGCQCSLKLCLSVPVPLCCCRLPHWVQNIQFFPGTCASHYPHSHSSLKLFSRNQPLLLLRICPFGRADLFSRPTMHDREPFTHRARH